MDHNNGAGFLDRVLASLRRLWPWQDGPGIGLDATNAIEEIARAVERKIAKNFPPDHGPEGVLIVVTDRHVRASLRRELTSDPFRERLLQAIHRELGPAAPAEIFISYRVDEGSPLEIHTELPPPQPFHLDVDGSPWSPRTRKSLYRAGRGEKRFRMQGAYNDLIFADSYAFVKRDAFELAWNPALQTWVVRVDDEARPSIRVERDGVTRTLQGNTYPLQAGDVVVLVGDGLALRITFHPGRPLT